MISFVEWIQQWKFSNYAFKDLAYEINHRWAAFPTRTDLNNHHYLRNWLENNGASEDMLMTFDKAWIIYEQEKDLATDQPGTKIRRVDISLSKHEEPLDVPPAKGNLESGISDHGLRITLTDNEISTLRSSLELTYDYINWMRFSRVQNSRYSLNTQHLDSIRDKLESCN